MCVSVCVVPPAHWDCKVENGQHVGPRLLDEQVSDDGGSNGGVTGFPNTHQPPRQQQRPEMLTEDLSY